MTKHWLLLPLATVVTCTSAERPSVPPVRTERATCDWPCADYQHVGSPFVDDFRSDMNAAASQLSELCLREFVATGTCPDFSNVRRGLAFPLPDRLVWHSLCVVEAAADRCFVVATDDAQLSAGDFWGHAWRANGAD